MTCEVYNLLKEGDLRNTEDSGATRLSSSEINSLYDGNTGSVATTISGSGVASIGLLAEWGEAFDFCYVDYYTNDPDPSNISISYWTTSGTELDAILTATGVGVYRAEINTFARFIQFNHTVSGASVDLNQIDVIGQRLETKGFGTSGSPVDYFHVTSSPIGTTSSVVQKIPLYNDTNHADVVRVAVAPTFTVADSQIFLSTSPSGVFYGIDDYGFKQPANKPASLVDDDFTSWNFPEQWDRLTGSNFGHKITPTPEGLYIDLTKEDESDSAAGLGPFGSRRTAGIVSKDYFTAQSFTAEIEIKFLDVYEPNADWNSRDIFFVFANGYPIVDTGYYGNYSGERRRGTSTAGVCLLFEGLNEGVKLTNLYNSLRVTDNMGSHPLGQNIDNEFSWEENGIHGEVSAEDTTVTVKGPTLSELEDLVNGGDSLGDLTAAASWHNWKISYDHNSKQFSCYVDNILISTYFYRVDKFGEGCKLAVGFEGAGGVQFVLRNFKFNTEGVYKEKNVALASSGGTATATISGAQAFYAIDGDTSVSYVAPDPTDNTHFRVDFDNPYNVTRYTIKQKNSGTYSAYGKSWSPDVARSVLVDFGGVRSEVHSLPNSSSHVSRSPTYSGTTSTVSGISYVDFQFLDYDLSGSSHHALILDEIRVFAENLVEVVPPEDPNENHKEWFAGSWNNLSQEGSITSNTLSLKDKVSPEAANTVSFPEYIRKGIDYDTSSVSGNYHHAEALFAPSVGGSWLSGTQVSTPFWIWRVFPEHSFVKAVYWNSDLLPPSNVVNRFKFQYLKIGGDPNSEIDWEDFPIIQETHLYTHNQENQYYKNYRDYLISNNDGEYYTDYFLRPNDTSFTIGASSSPTGIVVPTWETDTIVFSGSNDFPTTNGLRGYVEFDEAVLTTGVRFVIDDVLESGKEAGSPSPLDTAGDARSNIGLSSFRVYRTHGAGSYTSPVIDTGSKQNTERVKVQVYEPDNTSAAVFVRSNSNPPQHSFDPEYEVWVHSGLVGNNDIVVGAPSGYTRTIVREGKHIFLLPVPKMYDPTTDLWQNFTGYPTSQEALLGGTFEPDQSGASPGLLPDNTVWDNATFLDSGELYVAVYSTGDVRTPRIMKYVFDSSAEGWKVLSDNRPPFSEDATMVGVEDKLYFINEDGTISYFNTSTANWVIINSTMPTYGSSSRKYVAAALWENKIYLFGGRVSIGGDVGGSPWVDILDLASDTISLGSEAPFDLQAHQAIVVNEQRAVYLLPIQTFVGSGSPPVLKYYFDEDSWEVVESMMWSRTTHTDQEPSLYHRSELYYQDSGYIYALSDVRLLSRAKVVPTEWVNFNRPHFRDSVWGSSTQTAVWKPLASFGETMPQERYFQFKVELYSNDQVNTPTLESVNVVIPQEVEIPASGVSNVYLKVGVGSEESHMAWYSGEYGYNDNSGDYSILYTTSEDGLSWRVPAVASGIVYGNFGTVNQYVKSVYSPWVVENSSNDYEFWFVKYDTPGAGGTDPDIYYSRSTSAQDISLGTLAVKVISNGVISQTGDGVLHPCVIKTDETTYQMWYTGISGETKRIFYTESADGIAWANHQKVVDIGVDTVNGYDELKVYRPVVIKESSVYRMWYSAEDGDSLGRILYTESLDGVNWEFPRLIVSPGFEGRLDGLGVDTPFVTKDGNDLYYLYYFGYDGQKRYLIKAESPDGLEWFNPVQLMPPNGIKGVEDAEGIIDFFTIIQKEDHSPNTVFTSGQIKIYD